MNGIFRLSQVSSGSSVKPAHSGVVPMVMFAKAVREGGSLRRGVYAFSVEVLCGMLLFFLTTLGGGVPIAYARPLEVFTSSFSLECGDSQSCFGTMRSEAALGRYTGVTLYRGTEGSIEAEVKNRELGRFVVEADDSEVFAIALSWDGDPHPNQLSASGLNCLDLTQGGAAAFVLSKVRVDADCENAESLNSCPAFSIESRVYDARDPTGQRFSSSTSVRRISQEEADLYIPFSNFVTEGPRGKGDFTCAGAVTITMRLHGFSSLELELGPIMTNGQEGLTPLPSITPSAAASPIAVEVAATPTVTPLPSVPEALQSPTSPTDTSAPNESPLADAESQPLPAATVAPAASGAPLAIAAVPTVLPTRVETVTERLIESRRSPRSEEEEEVTYGEVVAAGR